MKIKNEQFDAIAYIFEKNNGNTLCNYENQTIGKSGLQHIPVDTLANAIVSTFNKQHPNIVAYRISAYWALSK